MIAFNPQYFYYAIEIILFTSFAMQFLNFIECPNLKLSNRVGADWVTVEITVGGLRQRGDY